MSIDLLNTAPYVGNLYSQAQGIHTFAVDADIDQAVSVVTTTAAYAQLAANDTVQVVSAEAADITQSVTIIGVDSTGERTWETIALDTTAGTTAVDSVKTWAYIENCYLDLPATGAVTLRRKTGATFINSIAIAALSADVVQHLSGTGFRPCVAGWWCAAEPAAAIVTFQLRWYPSAASCRSSGTGYRILDQVVVRNNVTATEAVMSNPVMRRFPSPLQLPAGGWIAVFALATGADNKTGSAGMQVFDVPVV